MMVPGVPGKYQWETPEVNNLDCTFNEIQAWNLGMEDIFIVLWFILKWQQMVT